MMGTDEGRARDAAELAVADAKFAIGDVVRHRIHPFRGVIYDVALSRLKSDS